MEDECYSDENDVPLSAIKACFTGHDQVTKSNNCVRQVQNILTEKSGTRKSGVDMKRFMQAWNLLITEDIIEKIVIHTNLYKKMHSLIIEPSTPTDAGELRGLFGLLYTIATLRISRVYVFFPLRYH